MVERGKGRVFKEHKFEDRARNLMGTIGEIRGLGGLGMKKRQTCRFAL